jgi:Carboxymuconolactone decarboxylase family
MSGRIKYTEISPEGVEALGDVYNYVTQSGLSDVLVELVYLRVSQINGCAYCVDMHTRPVMSLMFHWSSRCLAPSSSGSEVTSTTGKVLFHLRSRKLPMGP